MYCVNLLNKTHVEAYRSEHAFNLNPMQHKCITVAGALCLTFEWHFASLKFTITITIRFLWFLTVMVANCLQTTTEMCTRNQLKHKCLDCCQPIQLN